MSFDSSAYASRGRFKPTKFVPSSVDESLFGELKKTREPDPIPNFEPPWVDTGKNKLKSPPKPLLFYCPTTSSPFSSRPSSASSRPSSRTSSRTPDRKYKPVKFSPTVVDNTLFGEKKKEQLHSLQTEKFFTSMEKKELSFDGEVCNSYRPQSSMCSSRTARAQSSRRSQTPVRAKPSLPPWRWCFSLFYILKDFKEFYMNSSPEKYHLLLKRSKLLRNSVFKVFCRNSQKV